MSTFAGRLRLDFGDWGPGVGRIAILLEPLAWRDIVVPAGFMSDGASVPRLLWWWLPPWGDVATCAALVHDWLLTQRDAGTPHPGADTRRAIDRLFRDALIDLGISRWRAWLTWVGVRAFAIIDEDILPALRR